MERCDLAKDFSISRIITGLWQIADMERRGPVDPESAASEMARYAEAGFTTFDLADHYGSAEDIAGAFRERYSEQVPAEILTKWVPPPGPLTRDQVRQAVERSLQRLRTSQIDLLQFHAWRYFDPSWLDGLFWLDELRREGLIRYLGLTNFDTPHLAMVYHSGIEVVTNQVCFSLLDTRPRRRMLGFCAQSGIKLLAYGTLAGGFLSERWLGKPEPSAGDLATWSQMKYFRFIQAAGGWDRFQGVLRAAHRVAQRLGVSIANVACRFVLEHPGVGGIIVGARLGEADHLSENLRLFDFSLDDESKIELEEAIAALRPIPGESGDEYRRPPFLTASGDLSHHVDSFPSPYPVQSSGNRMWVSSGTPWEDLAGYSRALRIGDRIWVSGTTATHRDRVIGGSDPASQAHFAIDKIEGALESLGSSLENVVRTRIYLPRMEDWEAVARVHGERFGRARPANTLIRADLVDGRYLVEIEAEALVLSSSPAPR
ncbi:MAG: hypothetical protein KatS3mg115_2560 [Candidatus Poribacteria bacterium]|nr:MAG: hypothetical protein KatS3mg115_2560 [Candidatus Poribacteria bacterium]